jgi:16S rRNA (adenine1518-N6/adenine1519-N6)-dimethyltransferase
MKDLVQPKKHLGQHFLNDRNIAARIADAIPDNQIPLLEIGPGMGMLTGFLLQRPNPLKLVEIDKESVAWLKDHYPQIDANDLIQHDFLKLDLSEIYQEPFGIVGNFPYNISSQILFSLVENHQSIPLLCGMFQKEVAERIAVKSGNKQYGILSVLLQTWYEVKLLFIVNQQSFSPPPKVLSGVVLITRKPVPPPVSDQKLYIRIVKAAFSQRRKMLKNSMLTGFRADVRFSFETLRAEQLSVDDYITLYHEIKPQLIVNSNC